jgi:hypothetical protein
MPAPACWPRLWGATTSSMGDTNHIHTVVHCNCSSNQGLQDPSQVANRRDMGPAPLSTPPHHHWERDIRHLAAPLRHHLKQTQNQRQRAHQDKSFFDTTWRFLSRFCRILLRGLEMILHLSAYHLTSLSSAFERVASSLKDACATHQRFSSLRSWSETVAQYC